MLHDSNTGDTQSTYMSPQQQYKCRSEEAGQIKGLIRLTDSRDQPIDRPSATPRYHSNYRDPLRSREEGCQRSSHYLSAIYRSEREGERRGKGHRHKDMRRPSLKSIYKAQISPLLNPSGPSQPAVIPLFSSSVSQDGLISNLRICLPASLSAAKLTDQMYK